MNHSSHYSKADITRLGTLARLYLESSQGGKVFAAVSRAIYLLTEEGELFWLTTKDAPMHRRCAEVSSTLPAPAVGLPFRVEDHQLKIDSGLAFDAVNALAWSEPRLSSMEILDLAKLPARAQSFFSSLDLSQARGFGQFIPQILSLTQASAASPAIGTSDPILRAAQPHVLDTAHACLERDVYRITQNVDSLVGLGSGLTPSGDDFLGGIFFAIHVLERAYPESKFIHPDIAWEAYSSRTHLISFTLLQDNASGHAIPPMYQIINGFLSGESPKSITDSFLQLIQVGHSTGWDLLTGLLTGLLTAYRYSSG